MKLTLAMRAQGEILVVDCSGRIVFGEESSLLRDTVKKALSNNNRIVLNLGEVNYIDSGGLGSLVELYTSAHKAGGAIKLTRLTKHVAICCRSPSYSRYSTYITPRRKPSNLSARRRLSRLG